MSGLWSDKNREGQEMRGMKRREGREYEGGNEGRARDERENLRKFLFFKSNTETMGLFHIQITKNHEQRTKQEGRKMTKSLKKVVR